MAVFGTCSWELVLLGVDARVVLVLVRVVLLVVVDVLCVFVLVLLAGVLGCVWVAHSWLLWWLPWCLPVGCP